MNFVIFNALRKLLLNHDKRFWSLCHRVGVFLAAFSLLWVFVAFQKANNARRDRLLFTEAHSGSFAQLSPLASIKRWDEFRYVFVGGLRSSGAITIEQLLGSQRFVLGMGINSKIVANTSNCERPLRANPKHQCVAVDGEGESVTRAFSEVYKKRGTMCKFGLDDRATEFGACAVSMHLTGSDLDRVGGRPAKSLYRLQLFSDWAQFWFSNGSHPIAVAAANQARLRADAKRDARRSSLLVSRKQSNLTSSSTDRNSPTPFPTAMPINVYGTPELPLHLKFNQTVAYAAAQVMARDARVLVEQGVPNLVTSLFLEAVLGADKTAFIFTLRHPLAVPRCRYLKCNVVVRLESWLAAHELMVQDLALLSRYIVVHYEGFTRSPVSLVTHLQRTAWGPLTAPPPEVWKYYDHSFAEPRSEGVVGSFEDISADPVSSSEKKAPRSTQRGSGQDEARVAPRGQEVYVRGFGGRRRSPRLTGTKPEPATVVGNFPSGFYHHRHSGGQKHGGAKSRPRSPARPKSDGSGDSRRNPKGQHRRLASAEIPRPRPRPRPPPPSPSSATTVPTTATVTQSVSYSARKRSGEIAKAKHIPEGQLTNATFLAPEKQPGYPLVSFRRSKQEMQWERDYGKAIRQPYNAEVVAQMQQFAARLAKFCYSLEHLDVVINGCGSDQWRYPLYVWRMKAPFSE